MVRIIREKCHKGVMAMWCVFALVLLVFGNYTSYAAISSQTLVEIEGFQISPAVEGFRTLYSVMDPNNEIAASGLVYGLKEEVTTADMIIGSKNKEVHSYQSTSLGEAPVSYSKYDYATTYAMTMRFVKEADFYDSEIIIRAYARLKNGNYIYSDCASMTVFSVASFLYEGGLMGTKEGHDYLYNNILKVVVPEYQFVDYEWCNHLVKPGYGSAGGGELPTVPTTTVPQTTTVADLGDPSVPKPIGMVVSCPSDNTIGVVWGYAEPNTFNVYIDNVLVASKVVAANYQYYGYLAGIHTVSVTSVVNGRESQKLTMDVAVTGTDKEEELTTKRTISYDNSTNEYSEPIPELPNLEAREDRMYFKMNNKTKGVYSDNQIYWCILGYDTNGNLCYVDANGNLIPASTSMNTITKGDRKCADISYTLSEKSYVYMPDIDSGRMYMSYGEQVYITFNMAADGRVGYAGPDLNNATDPNQDVLFEFIEFTITDKEYWGNTSRVDFYTFPTATRLIGEGGFNNYPGDADKYDRTVGDLGTRESIFKQYKNEVPDKFDTLVTDKRIMAPCKSTFNEGAAYANYFDNYINEFWNKYSTQDLVFTCDAGKFKGRVNGDVMVFTKEGDSGTYYIYKPTTQDVLEGKGNFNRGNSTELVIEAQLCAAFNRGVATEPENYGNEEAFYKNANSNFYSGFWHEHSYDGLAYGFCYDDVFDYSTLLHYTNPTGLIIDLKW